MLKTCTIKSYSSMIDDRKALLIIPLYSLIIRFIAFQISQSSVVDHYHKNKCFHYQYDLNSILKIFNDNYILLITCLLTRYITIVYLSSRRVKDAVLTALNFTRTIRIFRNVVPLLPNLHTSTHTNLFLTLTLLFKF